MLIYLANPFGFSSTQKEFILPLIKEKIESFGHIVWEPFSKNNQIDFTKEDWAYNVGQLDKLDVENCDAIFAVCNGTPPDEGVMIELGMAIALNKKIYIFRDDFRRCTDSEDYPLNLMVFCGLPKNNWKDYYFTSIEDIKL